MCAMASAEGPIPAVPEGFRRGIDRRLPGDDFAGRGDPHPFFFMQMADTQLGFEASWAPNYDVPDNWQREIETMNRAIAEINRLRPAFAIVCGDLINAFPGAQGRAEQILDFKEICRKVDPLVPLVCVCGNHDIGNRPNAATIEEYRREFGDDYFTFWVHAVKCIVVNSQLWKDSSDASDSRVAHDEWLKRELESASEAEHILVFAHVPLFIFEPDEPDGYFNVDMVTRREVLELLAAHGVRTVFCGHYHRNAGGKFTGSGGQVVELVVTGAVGANIKDNIEGSRLDLSGQDGPLVGNDVSGLRLVFVGDRVTHRWCSFNALELVSEADVSSL